MIWARIKSLQSRSSIQWAVFGLVAVWVMIFTHVALLVEWYKPNPTTIIVAGLIVTALLALRASVGGDMKIAARPWRSFLAMVRWLPVYLGLLVFGLFAVGIVGTIGAQWSDWWLTIKDDPTRARSIFLAIENSAFYVLLVICFCLVVTIFDKLEGREDKQDWDASKIFAAKRAVLWLVGIVLAMSVLWSAAISNQTIISYQRWQDGVVEGAAQGSSGGGCGVVVRHYFDNLTSE